MTSTSARADASDDALTRSVSNLEGACDSSSGAETCSGKCCPSNFPPELGFDILSRLPIQDVYNVSLLSRPLKHLVKGAIGPHFYISQTEAGVQSHWIPGPDGSGDHQEERDIDVTVLTDSWTVMSRESLSRTLPIRTFLDRHPDSVRSLHFCTRYGPGKRLDSDSDYFDLYDSFAGVLEDSLAKCVFDIPSVLSTWRDESGPRVFIHRSQMPEGTKPTIESIQVGRDGVMKTVVRDPVGMYSIGRLSDAQGSMLSDSDIRAQDHESWLSEHVTTILLHRKARCTWYYPVPASQTPEAFESAVSATKIMDVTKRNLVTMGRHMRSVGMTEASRQAREDDSWVLEEEGIKGSEAARSLRRHL